MAWSRTLGLAVAMAALAACGDPRPLPDGGNTPADSGATDQGAALDAQGLDLGLAPDGGGTDAGLPDAGDSDAGDSDAGDSDAGAGDSGPADAGSNPCSLPAAASDYELFRATLACVRDSVAAPASKDAVIAELVTRVEAGGGFPIVDGTLAVFVYVRDALYDAEDDSYPAEDYDPARRLEPISVAGDFNAWTPSAGPLTAEDRGFFHAEIGLVVADDRWRYKFVAKDGGGADVYFSDPLSRRFDYDNNGRISIVRGGSSQGHLEWIRSVHATLLADDRPLYFYLPPGYEQNTASAYPVLYMQDGGNLFDIANPRASFGSWDVDGVIEAELSAQHIAPLIVVAIPNDVDRLDEYTHTMDDVGGGLQGGRGDEYADFVVHQIKPLVDQRYRTRPEHASTAVLGSSLGGLESLYMGLLYPDVFGCVGGMSPSLFWGGGVAGASTAIDLYEATADLTSHNQRFYLDSGGGPGSGCPSSSASDNYCETIQLRDVLVSLGIDTFPDDPNAVPLTPAGVNIYHWWTPNAAHNEAAWGARIFRPLRLCFPPP